MSEEIGAYDAKTKLPELLRQVQRGKRFTITHRGRPIADLVPYMTTTSVQDFSTAIRNMLDFERVTNVDSEDVAAWIREGRQ